jgi:hypothetical protein
MAEAERENAPIREAYLKAMDPKLAVQDAKSAYENGDKRAYVRCWLTPDYVGDVPDGWSGGFRPVEGLQDECVQGYGLNSQQADQVLTYAADYNNELVRLSQSQAMARRP